MAVWNASAIALVVLVLQNTSLVLLMRHSLTTYQDSPPYITSTAVMVMEMLKLGICLAVVYMESGGSRTFVQKLRVDVANKPLEMAKLMVPASLYTVQNNLLFVALRNLDAATYSVCYQTKILTTAVFSVVLLNKKLTAWKWGALFLLTVGVALAKLSDISSEPVKSAEGETMSVQSPLLGFICVLTAACTSGFAGVYFEMLLKSSKTSLFIRNIQMGLPSIVLSLVTVGVKDGQNVAKGGFFQGYNLIVVSVILLQAAGGLVVAVVVKYADSIRKSFAAAVSIVASCGLSMFFFDVQLNKTFALGVMFVCMSVYMYGRPAPERGLPSFHKNFGLVRIREMERRRSVTRRV